MTGQEVKKMLAEAGLTHSELAARLGKGEEYMRKLMSSREPIAPALERHILLELGARKSAAVSFAVTLPGKAVDCHLHSTDKLTEAERLQVLHCIYDYLGAELASRASNAAASAPRA